MKRKRTEITIEVEEVIHVSSQAQSLPLLWCAACGAETTMLSPQQAAVIRGVTVRTINSWVESDRIHFIETKEGLLLVCLSSLSRNLKNLNARTLE